MLPGIVCRVTVYHWWLCTFCVKASEQVVLYGSVALWRVAVWV